MHGFGYFEKTDISKFQDDLNQKIAFQSKKQIEINDIEQEITILKYTENVVKSIHSETVTDLKNYEVKYGVTGLLSIEADIEELARKKGSLDYLKGKTVEELTSIIETLRNKIEEKRDLLKPLIEDHKTLKSQIKETEEEHKKKRIEYEKTISESKEEFEIVLKEYKTVHEPHSKKQALKIVLTEKTKSIILFRNLLDQEARNVQGSSSFSKDAKTMKEAMLKEVTEKEASIQLLKEKREEVKEASNNLVEQNKMLNDLKFLLEEKLKCKKRMKTNTTSSFKTIREQYNRAVLE